eukprot:2478429-Pyramimonas_sp.AAC.1
MKGPYHDSLTLLVVLTALYLAGCDEGKTFAAGALRHLSVSDPLQAPIVSSGSIPVLVELVCSGNPDGRTEAANAIFNLSMLDDDNRVAVNKAGGIEALVDLLRSGNAEEMTAAA